MQEGFFRKSRDMSATDYGLDPPFFEAVANFIGAPDSRRYGGDSDQVRIHGVVIDIATDIFVIKSDFIMIRRMSRQITEGQGALQQLRANIFFYPRRINHSKFYHCVSPYS